jgi:hypothetical protein
LRERAASYRPIATRISDLRALDALKELAAECEKRADELEERDAAATISALAAARGFTAIAG